MYTENIPEECLTNVEQLLNMYIEQLLNKCG